MADRTTFVALVGVCLALFGPALLALVNESVLSPPHKLGALLLSQLTLVLLCVGVLLVATRWERRPLSSIGLRPLRWQSVA